MSNEQLETNTPPAKNLGTLRRILLIGVPAVALAIGLFLYWISGRFVETDNAYVKAELVPISAEVSAAIDQLLVKENEFVSKDQVLFELRSEPFRLAVEESRAHLAQVRTDLAALKASYLEKQANIELAQGNYQFAQKELKRQLDLKGKNFVSESTMDDLEHNVDVTQQQLQVLTMDLKRIAASLGGDANAPLEQHPSYLSALAKLQQDELALSRTRVRAPVDGIVSQLPTVGQYVRTGNTVAALVATEKLWVEANFSEVDLTHVKVGQSAEVHIDSYPDFVWQGKVESISPATGAEFSVLPAQNATGNWVKIAQRVPVRIDIMQPRGAPSLRSGLSAVVEIDTEHRHSLFKSQRVAQQQDTDNTTEPKLGVIE